MKIILTAHFDTLSYMIQDLTTGHMPKRIQCSAAWAFIVDYCKKKVVRTMVYHKKWFIWGAGNWTVNQILKPNIGRKSFVNNFLRSYDPLSLWGAPQPSHINTGWTHDALNSCQILVVMVALDSWVELISGAGMILAKMRPTLQCNVHKDTLLCYASVHLASSPENSSGKPSVKMFTWLESLPKPANSPNLQIWLLI